MLRKTLLASAIALAIGAPAFASQCPADMAKIDAALQTASLTAEQKAEVEQLRTQGEQQHTAGDHAASVETLGKAKTILGID